MRIIQSFWSKPSFGSRSNLHDNRFSGGWLSKKYQYISLALSCLKFKQFYPDVELYTDRRGNELLINTLKLPYSKVHTLLDDLDEYDENLWTLGKIYVYGAQHSPFIHADGDIFIWSALGGRIENASVICQNEEDNHSYYRPVAEAMKDFDIPEWLKSELGLNERILVANTGIVGGKDLEFFKRYCDLAFKIINNNLDKIHHLNVGVYSVLIEQYLIRSLAQRDNKAIEYLDQDISLVRTHLVPSSVRYIHPVGEYKKRTSLCAFIEFALRSEFPDFYFRILKLLQEKSV